MHRFCIDSTVLGTARHIVGDAEGFLWSDSVPRSAWHLTGDLKTSSASKCLDTLFKLCGHVTASVPAPHLAAVRTLVSGSTPIPWQHVLPQVTFREYFTNLVQETVDVFSGLPFDYYEVAWAAGSRVLGSLRPVKVDIDALLSAAVASGGNAPALESFRPKKSGFAHPVVYDRFATRTGRLTVSEGPNILVLKKDSRSIMRSSFEGGSVVSLDFRALEARIVAAEAGVFSDAGDLYDDLSEKLFSRTVTRDVVKVAVLAELYGISRASLKAKLGVSDSALDYFISAIRTHFKVDDLKRRLKSQVAGTGKVLNRFGRPIPVPPGADNLLINSYAQSSGVDVAMLGFDAVLEQLGDDGIRPLFVLHDAIILDVRPDRLHDVQCCTSVTVPTYSIPFPLKFETVGNT